MDEPGGLLMYAIPEYRLPKAVVRRLTGALAGMGIEFKQNVSVGEDVQLDELIDEYDSVFLDTGAWKQNVIGIDGEECTIFGLNFLVEVKSWMRGKPGSDIVVVGAGNVAMDVAVTAKRLGAKSVTMAFRRPVSELKASAKEIEHAREAGVVLAELLAPKAVIREGERVTGMQFARTVAAYDERGKLTVTADENDLVTISCDAVLLAVGQKVDLSYLDERLGVLTERGRISVSEQQATSKPGVFAAGDAATGPSTVVEAMAGGYRAALAISEYLGAPIVETPIKEGFVKRGADCLDIKEPVKANTRPIAERSMDTEDDMGLPLEAVEREAHRCFNCSCYAVAPSDMATALMALRATVHTNLGAYSADEFFTRATKMSDILAPGEIVTSVELPAPNGTAHYDKFRERESIDFAVVGLGSEYTVEDGRIKYASIVLGAVAPVPIRAAKAEEYLVGRSVTEETAEKAAELALEGAEPLRQNAYKVDIARELVKRSILRMA